MPYQSGDILVNENDGFVNDIYIIVEEAKGEHYKSYKVYSREYETELIYPETYLKTMTLTGEEFRYKYGIKK